MIRIHLLMGLFLFWGILGCTQETAVSTPTQSLSEDTAVAGEAIDVTYFTAAQQEGPYYTVDKPTDRDNDLTVLAGASGTPLGEVIVFGGTVYDANGRPVPGLIIEIWQTDNSGAYNHPNDPATDSRDRNFQFYGEAMTDENGRYNFRTILPGQYEPRPRHIHVKIKQDGRELLTTQFYFTSDPDAAGIDPSLMIDLVSSTDDAGNAILVGERDVVLQR